MAANPTLPTSSQAEMFGPVPADPRKWAEDFCRGFGVPPEYVQHLAYAYTAGIADGMVKAYLDDIKREVSHRVA